MELSGTEVCAVTIHSLFDLDSDTYCTKLDFAKKNHKVQVLVGLDRSGIAHSPHPMCTTTPAAPLDARVRCLVAAACVARFSY